MCREQERGRSVSPTWSIVSIAIQEWVTMPAACVPGAPSPIAPTHTSTATKPAATASSAPPFGSGADLTPGCPPLPAPRKPTARNPTI